MISLGVVSDTHIPDRSRSLHPRLLSLFQDAHVQAILHAGDVCIPLVLEQLGEIAPVHAVRGNRDWVRLMHLPKTQTLEFGGVEIGLSHGHGSLFNYLFDKAHYMFQGLQESRFIDRSRLVFPVAKVIIFGHIHVTVNEWIDDILLFNPGSACCPHLPGEDPTAGLLHINGGGEVYGEIISLS